MVQRLSTKDLLLESFRELAQVRDIPDITIQDIADNCGVSKRTFYNYFTSREDLLIQEQATASPQTMKVSSLKELQDHWLEATLKYHEVEGYSENVARQMRDDSTIHKGLVELTQQNLRDLLASRIGEGRITPEMEFAIWFWSEAATKAQSLQGLGKNPVPLETWIAWEFNCMPSIIKEALEGN